MPILPQKQSNTSEILTENPHSHFSKPEIQQYKLAKTRNTQRKLEIVKSYLSLPIRLKRLQPWYQIRKPLEDQYRRRLIQLSQVEGKRLLSAVKQPKTRQYLQEFFQLQSRYDIEDEDAYYDEYGYDMPQDTPQQKKNEASRLSLLALLPLAGIFTMMKVKQQSVLTELGTKTYKDSLRYTLAESSVPISSSEISFIIKSMPDDMINFLLSSHSYPACENTIGTYQDTMTSILKQGFEKEWTQEEISNALNQYVGLHGESYPEYIYDRIARNEVTRFGNEAKVYGWNKQNIEFYDWIQGPGPCNEEEICLQMAEEGPYQVGNGPMPIDDTHVNCLCEIVEHR